MAGVTEWSSESVNMALMFKSLSFTAMRFPFGDLAKSGNATELHSTWVLTSKVITKPLSSSVVNGNRVSGPQPPPPKIVCNYDFSLT